VLARALLSRKLPQASLFSGRTMPNHAATDEPFPSRLPLPLAQLYRRAHNAKSAVERYIAAYYLWEAALKLLGAVAVVEYAERGPATPDIAVRLKHLARPALGHWWEFVRLLVPTLADAGDADFGGLRDRLLGKPTSDCPRAAGLDALLREVLENKPGARTTVQFMELFTRLVSLRNEEIGHGAAGQRPASFYERSAPALLAGVAEALERIDVLAGRSLVYIADVRRLASGDWLVERLSLSGSEVRRLESLTVTEPEAANLPRPGRLYVHGPDAASWRTLHPLVLFDAEAEQVFFLNARIRRKRAEYLCYTSGQVVKRDELGQEQRELLAKALGGSVASKEIEEWAERSSAAETAPLTQETAARRTIGEFELLSRLGRGGMGMVYRAWQPSLCRQVALKCLLRSGDPKSEARFAREIRALGRVDHPHLVKVFTSGADGDQWFYTMELVEGPDLAAVCVQLASSTALAVSDDDWTTAISTAREQQRRQETGLDEERQLSAEPAVKVTAETPRRSGIAHVARVVDIARQAAEAAHALHEAGVIHRDIKPGNILLTADGNQAVLMDLGLAQLADETEGRLTRTRQFVGTLRYASPEQQVGATLDRRADVYSLGATLWELLTLRPLFGVTEQMPTPDMILKLQQADPERVRKHNPRVPQDLDAIVMKCLAKEKERRYATAAELAADLVRWQHGEPVQAQPPSLGYLFRKKLRQYRVQATVAAAVLMAALVGAIVYFAETDAALHRVETALGEKNRAFEKLRAKEDELAGETVRSWLLPLAMQPDVLSNQEIEVLYTIGTQQDKALSIRCIEEATKDPRFARRLQVRSDYALHAVVGLDLKRRAQVERLLVAKLQEHGIGAEVHRDLTLTLVNLGDLSASATHLITPTLFQVITESQDPHVIAMAAKGLASAVALSDTEKRSRVAADTARTLAKAMTRTTHDVAMNGLAEGLAAVAPRMDAKEAGEFLTQTVIETDDHSTLRKLAKVLLAAAARMDAKEASEMLVKAMTRTTDGWALGMLAEVLAAVAARMDKSEAARVAGETATKLTQAMTTTKDLHSLKPLAIGLAAVGARMDSKDAARLAATTAHKLRRDLFPPVNIGDSLSLADGLAAVAPLMDAKEAAETLAQLVMYPELDQLLGVALSAATSRMDAKEAGEILSRAMAKTTASYALKNLALALSAVAARMDTKERARAATETAEKLRQAMTKAEESHELASLAEGLAAVAGQMDSKEAARVAAGAAHTLTQAMDTKDGGGLARLTEALGAVAARMDTKEAARVAAGAAHKLSEELSNQFMNKTVSFVVMSMLARGLAAVGARMDTKEAARMATEAANKLNQAMSKTRDNQALWELTTGLSAVAPLMDSKKGSEILIQAMTRAEDSLGAQEALSRIVGSASWLDQDLVELLKNPLCVSYSQRIVLDVLGRRHQRRFADQWEFVHFAEEHNLGLDFTGPPKHR
jgi:serine/threonine protein kinase